MRRYTLASNEARNHVDLREYEDIIIEAVREFMPTAVVRVEMDCYYASPTPKKGTAVKIGRKICKSALSKYCVHIPKLFSSIETKEETHDENKQHHGGHF